MFGATYLLRYRNSFLNQKPFTKGKKQRPECSRHGPSLLGENYASVIWCVPPLRQFGQQPARAGDRLADAHLFLHLPAGGDWMDHGHFKVYFHRHHVDNAPGSGVEQIDSLGRRKEKRG